MSEFEKPDISADQAAAEAFRVRLIDCLQTDPLLRARLEHPSFDLERLTSLDSPEAITSWALMHLDLPFAVRAGTYGCCVGPVLKPINRPAADSRRKAKSNEYQAIGS